MERFDSECDISDVWFEQTGWPDSVTAYFWHRQGEADLEDPNGWSVPVQVPELARVHVVNGDYVVPRAAALALLGADAVARIERLHYETVNEDA